jgi:integrase
MIDCIYKPNGSRIWRWKYRQQPKDGKIEDVSLNTSDKQVAEKRRAERLREKQHERDGLILPKPVRDAAQRKLSEHLQDFVGDLRRRGKSEKYLANLQFRVGALIPGCGWNTAKDVTADSFQTWRRGQVEISAKTANDYLEAARCFFNWLVKNGRVQTNPLASVEKVRTEGRETRQRRAFSGKEMQQLLAAVPADRKAVYLMAVHTGLRRSELAALKWGDVRLDAVVPFVLVRASTTKNGKSAPMRLHPEVVKELEEIRGNSQPEEPVFKRFPRIERFRRDLKKAGVAYRDEAGNFADFHSLRVTLCTNLQRAGVPGRTAMALMRHSDRRLTDKIYTDENLLGTSAAIDALPHYTETASQGASQELVAGSQNGSSGGTAGSGSEMKQSVVSIGESHIVALNVTSGHNMGNGGSGGARTRNLCRDRAAL